ncbi:TPA: hypothetical protein ACSTJZ_003162 [Serratia fonticola]
MNDSYYQLYAQHLALRTALAAVIQVMPDEQKEIILKLLDAFSESDYKRLMGSTPTDDANDETFAKIDRAFKETYESIIEQATPDLALCGPHLLQ